MPKCFDSFAALDAHVESLNAADVAAAISLSNGTNKTSGEKEEAEKDGKKRKAKGQASSGVEKLKKVNTKGMAKLSSFFQKKEK